MSRFGLKLGKLGTFVEKLERTKLKVMNSNGMDMNAYRDNEEVEEFEHSKNDDVEERIRRILRNGAQKKVGDKKSIIDPRLVGTSASPDPDQTRTKFSNDSYRQEDIIRPAEAEQELRNARFPQRASSSKTRKEHARDESLRRSTKARPLSQVTKSLSFREPTTSMSKLIPSAGEDFYNNRRASGGASYPSPSPSPNSERVSYDRTSSKLSIPPSRQTSVRSNKSNHSNSSFKRTGGIAMPRDPLSCSFYRDCRSNSFAFSMDNGSVPLRDLPPKEQRHRKVGYCVIIFSSILLLLAVLCIIISLHFSASIGVRKENEDLLRGIVQTASSLNVTPTTSISSSAAALDNIGAEASPSNQSEPLSNHNSGAVMSNLQQPRQRRLTTAWTRLILSSPPPSSSTTLNNIIGSSGRSKSNKIASLTRTHKNNSKSPSSTPAPAFPSPATAHNLILQQLMMSHASYYETPSGQHYEEQTGGRSSSGLEKLQITARQDQPATDTSVEDHDEAPVVIRIGNTA